MSKQDELYFTERVDTNEITWYLNSKEKQLEKISSGKKMSRQLNKELVVFLDKNDYEGVLRNNKDEIVPFKYNNITLAGEVLVAENSKRAVVSSSFIQQQANRSMPAWSRKPQQRRAAITLY